LQEEEAVVSTTLSPLPGRWVELAVVALAKNPVGLMGNQGEQQPVAVAVAVLDQIAPALGEEMVAPGLSSCATALRPARQRFLLCPLVMSQLTSRSLLPPTRVVPRLRIMSIRLMVRRGQVLAARPRGQKQFLV
tara:strand:+ start:2057 stop:2458 length:402 start_codon:yes stop_codon:yes gene_type:complete